MRKASDLRRAKAAPLHNSGIRGVYEVAAKVAHPANFSRHALIDIHHRLNRVSGGLVIAMTRGLSNDELAAYGAELHELGSLLEPDVRSQTRACSSVPRLTLLQARVFLVKSSATVGHQRERFT